MRNKLCISFVSFLTVFIFFNCNTNPAENEGMSTVTDIDGNTYQTVKIGNQWWMAENLKVTHYRNGDAIPEVTINATWIGLTSGAYCSYDNYEYNSSIYGYLYNWFAVNDSRNIAPDGWHVATDAEWQTLVDYLGGESVAGGKLKATGTVHWYSPNAGATNESGFSGLPGGQRAFPTGAFNGMKATACFWSSTDGGSDRAWFWRLFYESSITGNTCHFNQYGFSVRCIRD